MRFTIKFRGDILQGKIAIWYKEKIFTSLNQNPIHTVASTIAVRRFFDIVIDLHAFKRIFQAFCACKLTR